MYYRYIPSGASYVRITEEEAPEPRAHTAAPPSPHGEPEEAEPKEKKGALAGLLKGLKLDSLDTGDILLLLILLFLFLEGDDMELIIALGLLLLMGLD